jgi:SagB-type dehydrogenase family enzyme
MVLESPLASYRAVLHSADAVAAVVACAAEGGAEGGVEAGAPARLPSLSSNAPALRLLAAAGLLEVGERAEDEPGGPLGLWDFHDLLFHARSRPGRGDGPFGALFRHAGRRSEPPAVPPPAPGGGPVVDLAVPSWPGVRARDVTLTDALELRRSVRGYAQRPVTVDQLSELLYRSARVRGLRTGTIGVAYTAVDRPYPAGGAMGELELYVTVAQCDGLEPGSYRYDAAGHRLRRLDVAEADRRAMLAGAAAATGGAVDPQVLVTVTARFTRMAWKYSGIAYATTLKHVGALYQTMYLVATAIGLAPCGLGSGDTALAARAFGTAWAAESSVGDFLIGSAPAGLPAGPGAFADVVAAVRASPGNARC